VAYQPLATSINIAREKSTSTQNPNMHDSQTQALDEIQIFDAATSDCSKQIDTACQTANRPLLHFVPPPPAKFNRKQAGIAKATTSRKPIMCSAQELIMIQSMKKRLYEVFVVEDRSCTGDKAQEDLWAAVDNLFLQ
jgi:hypothetical protein